MIETTISSFFEYDEKIDGKELSSLCRGVSKSDYELTPSLFRNQLKDDFDLLESNMMWLFKSHSLPHIDKKPDSEIEWLTIAQHYGLPTRLLDWSLSPLVACYFAVCNHSDHDGAVYIYDVEHFKKIEEINISNLDNIEAFFPPHVASRVTAQSGMFTVHPNSRFKLDNEKITKIIIPKKIKSKILYKLNKYGIHDVSLFPDLEGLARWIKNHNSYK